MKYITVRLIPRLNQEFVITHFLNPDQEETLSKSDGERMLAVEQILGNAQDLIEAAYDIQFQVREWDHD